jgi:hypothetical protein
VLLGILFKGRLNGWDYTASTVDEMHVSTGRWWNDTVMEEQKVLGHTLSQYDFVEHEYQQNAFGLNSDLRGKISGINRPVHGTACELQNYRILQYRVFESNVLEECMTRMFVTQYATGRYKKYTMR